MLFLKGKNIISNCSINWAECWPPETGQEALMHQRSKGTGFDQCVGVSPEGRERGRNEKCRKNAKGVGGASREKTERVGGVGSGSVFVHCVKCDHVLELLRQLGSSPVPGFQLVTLRGDRILPRLTLHLLLLLWKS